MGEGPSRGASARVRGLATAGHPLSELLATLANGDRRELVDVLHERHRDGRGGATITELAEAIGATRLSTSRHLAILRDARVLDVTRSGARRSHALRFATFLELDDWLAPYLVSADEGDQTAT